MFGPNFGAGTDQ